MKILTITVLAMALCLTIVAENAYCEQQKYAVLFNGAYNTANNYAAYVNDTCQMFDVLHNLYQFPEENIFIFQSDGQDMGKDCTYLNRRGDARYVNSPWDLDRDGDYDIEVGAATAENLFTKFDELAGIMDSDDLFYFWATDHGSLGEELYDSEIAAWGETTFTDEDFALSVNPFSVANEIYVFGQCFGGGFIDNLTRENRLIVTAADYDEYSWGFSYLPTQQYKFGTYSNEGKDRAEFLNQWARGLSGLADLDGDGFVSMYEAFLFAEGNDYFGPDGVEYCENPQWDDFSGIGDTVTLGTITQSGENGKKGKGSKPAKNDAADPVKENPDKPDPGLNPEVLEKKTALEAQGAIAADARFTKKRTHMLEVFALDHTGMPLKGPR